MNSKDSRRLGQVGRRRFIRRGVELSVAASLPGVLVAHGSSEDQSTSGTKEAQVAGTVVYFAYPDWMGDKEIAWFEQKYPGATIKEVTDASTGNASIVSTMSHGRGEYDAVLAGLGTAEQLQAANLLAEFNEELCPNVVNVPQVVRDKFPMGAPTDIGRTGFAYRKDMIKERPKSWADLWELAKKYPGKTTMMKYDTDMLGAALLLTGHKAMDRDQAAIDEAKNALIDVKPNLRAFVAVDFMRAIAKGLAYFAVSYDLYAAPAIAKDPNIVWVDPEEGMPAFLEGRCPLKDSENLSSVYAFLNQSMDPKIYANFVNSTFAHYVMPAAEPYINEPIKTSPLLRYEGDDAFEKLNILSYPGAEAQARVNKAWSEVLAA